jgi:hypothetical protein
MSGILQTFAYGRAFSIIPANTVAPVVSGTATVGQTLSTTNGTWSGIPTPTFTYQWQRVTTNISGATSSTYVLVAADVGSTIRCVVTATNTVGSTSANSNSTAAVAATVPGAPTIGTATATSSSTATVSYTAPASNGGATITSYTATSSPGGITGTLSTSGSGTITVSGLTSETSYTFTVRATNSVGQSAASGSSNSITTAASYWMAFLNNTSGGSATVMFTSANSSGATTLISGGNNGNFARMSSAGAVASSGFYTTNGYVTRTTGNPFNQAIYPLVGAASPDGSEVYAGGYASAGNQGTAVTKVNASGTLQWFSNYNLGASSNPAPALITQIGEDGFIYAAGYVSDSVGFFLKYHPNGTVQWIKRASRLFAMSATGDGTYSYFTEIRNDSGSATYAHVYQYNTAASSKNWGIEVRPNGGLDFRTLSIKQLQTYGGALYAVGTLNYGSPIFTVAILVKINSSGSIVWSRYVKDADQTNYGVSVTVGADGYLYFTSANANVLKNCITKLDTNGNLVWQRKLTVNTNAAIFTSTVAITGSTMYWSMGWGSSNAAILMLKLPTDGSKTGTYTGPDGNPYVYESFSSFADLSSYIASGSQGSSLTDSGVSQNTSGNAAGSRTTALTALVNIP